MHALLSTSCKISNRVKLWTHLTAPRESSQQPRVMATIKNAHTVEKATLSHDAAAQNLKDTTAMASASTLKSLSNPIVVDVRSPKEVAAAKGGAPVAGSIHVPLNVDGQPQGTHLTTTEEFRKKLLDAGVDLSSPDNAYITHCTAGNTDYIGRGARAAALLRNLGFMNAHNGGSADDIRAALKNET